MNIVIASGKGGTGKTTLAINLAYYLATMEKKTVRLFDCDVEAPNANIFLKAKIEKTIEVQVPRPAWNKENCSSCGHCANICQYNAIAKINDKILIFDELCHSCGACTYLCPTGSLVEKKVPIGKIELAPSYSSFYFGHGILNIGESLAPIIISKLKNHFEDHAINIIDAPPGTTCPVVKSMENMDYCILVTEPTPFGLSDLKLAASLAGKMGIPTGIVINRSSTSDNIIESFSNEENIPILGKIPFNKKYAISYSKGHILLQKHPELIPIFSNLFKTIQTKQIIPNITTKKKHVSLKESIVTLNCDKKINPTEIVIISGKGGTGKTTISSALSELMKIKVLSDSDVDASNLHLLLKPQLLQKGHFAGGKTYSINSSLCSQCGVCSIRCHFNAIKKDSSDVFFIDELACEGCGLCAQICPSSAISNHDSISGEWFISKTEHGHLSHARLGIGKENSGKLVSLVRDNANKLAQYNQAETIINDGPPGIGCPVISSISGASLAIVITEPTLSGIHDMKRALKLTQHFDIKALIIINKSDLNDDITTQIINTSSPHKVIGTIPFDHNINNSLMKGENIIKHGKGKAYQAIINIWENLKKEIYELQ